MAVPTADVNRTLTWKGSLIGTADYVAPEQAQDARNVDIRADIYSLGCTFYFLLTGRPPFSGGSALQKIYRHETEEAQLIAHALGGQVGPMADSAGKPRLEVGFQPLSLNVGGQIEPMLAGIPWTHAQFQTHGQEVKTLPEGAANFASSAACKNQAFRAGLRTFGFQFHFECDRPMVDMLIKDSEEWMRPAGITVSNVAAQADRDYPEFARVADRLCVNLATYLFPYDRKLRQ